MLAKLKQLYLTNHSQKKIKSITFHIGSSIIEVQNSYCYLGIDITNTGSFRKAHENLYKKAIKAQYSIFSSVHAYSDTPNIPLFLRLFDSLIKPVLLYGSEVWGVCKPQKRTKNGDFDTQNCSSRH